MEMGYYDSNGDVLVMPHTIELRIHPKKERFRWISLGEKDNIVS
jgi:hypothetical protein